MKTVRIGLWTGLLCFLAMRCLGGQPATAVATVTAGFVTAITVTSGGSGYTSEPAVAITGGGGSGATAKAILSGDKVALLVVLTAGSGYTSTPTVTLAAPAVESWMTFRMAPAVRVDGKVGQSFAVERLLGSTTTWTSWTNITVEGSGIEVVDLGHRPGLARYRSRFSVVPATATAKLTAGFVTGITVDVGGEGYLQPPRVTLIGGGGSGATAQAILDRDKVGAIIVLTAGSGYASLPTVKIEAPSGESELLQRMVPVLSLRVPLDGVNRIEIAKSILGPWMPMTNRWNSPSEPEVVDLAADEQARFYRLQTNSVPVGPDGFVWIPPGTFLMGSPANEQDRGLDEELHTVILTRGFWLSDHEVTQGEYESVMGTNPSFFTATGDRNLPVEQVSWFEALLYCQKLTARDQATGRITAQQAYRLPTEAEWEYAARAGTTGPRYGDLDDIAWYSVNSVNNTHQVKQKSSNSWGLFDMLGNVSEWCSDKYGFGNYPTGSVTNPSGASSGSSRIMRGGNWSDEAKRARSASRFRGWPERGHSGLGFRAVLASVDSLPPLSPLIVFHPKPVKCDIGQNANFSVTAVGTPPFSYQWQLNGVDIKGATFPTLSIESVKDTDAGCYRAGVLDRSGRLGGFSKVALLSVGTNVVPLGPPGFVWIPPGTFVMGSPSSELERHTNEVQHTVTLTQGFWMLDHEVTYTEYTSMMGNYPSDWGPWYYDRPVANVSWNDANSYCDRLTGSARAQGRLPTDMAYRLPTEAEWEYAARAGTTGRSYGAPNLIGWFGGYTTRPVKGKLANAWGLYDMLGNVSEWCADWYGDYAGGNVTDPTGPTGSIWGSTRVYRGFERSASRVGGDHDLKSSSIGFRPVIGFLAPPLITTHPQASTVTIGHPVQFSVAVTGTHPMWYQWQFNGVNMVGETQSTLTFQAQPSSAGNYRVEVGNAGGHVTSTVAKLVVNPESEKPIGTAGFVWIPPGTFLMGNPASNSNQGSSADIQHKVTLTRGFWLSDHEVTQGEYQAVMSGNPVQALPSHFKGDLNRPVEMVSWTDAVTYCGALTQRERAAGRITSQQVYRLPTEAEWEYAARAGTTELRYGNLDAIAWWSSNSDRQTHPVKQKAPNAWQLYDMLGNVFEWCSDWHGKYPTGSVADPIGPSSGFHRVVRGGSWNYSADSATSAVRAGGTVPGDRQSFIGFRPALSSVQ